MYETDSIRVLDETKEPTLAKQLEDLIALHPDSAELKEALHCLQHVPGGLVTEIVQNTRRIIALTIKNDYQKQQQEWHARNDFSAVLFERLVMPVLTGGGNMKEEFKFYPRGLAGGKSFYTRPPCEFKGCGKPSDFIAEGNKGSVLYSCCEKVHSGRGKVLGA